ncbi:MAG: hypothetical protein ED557_04075 [Balneola sp.]|nr:MAG: hypothetical protein ED557_04075 [Balneola sp.]
MKYYDSEKLIKLCLIELKKGTEEQTVLCYLKALDVSMIDAIKIIRKARKIDLGQAKALVSSNKCWAEETIKMNRFNEQLLNKLKEEYDLKISSDSFEISIDLDE